MAHEQLSVPRSQLDQDLSDLEMFTDEERFLFLRDEIFHPMLSGDLARKEGIKYIARPDVYGALRRDIYDASKLPVDSTEPAEFILSSVPSPLVDEKRPIKSLRDLPYLTHDYYQTDERFFMNVPQCYMMRVPKDRDPCLYVTMDKCSAIIAHTDTDVYMAHVGYSMIDQASGVIDYLRQQGISADDIRIVGNVSGENADGTEEESEIAWPRKKDVLGTTDAFVALGIPEKNFIGFSDASPDGVSRPITEVIVTGGDMFVDQADYVNRYTLSDDLMWSKYILVATD